MTSITRGTYCAVAAMAIKPALPFSFLPWEFLCAGPTWNCFSFPVKKCWKLRNWHGREGKQEIKPLLLYLSVKKYGVERRGNRVMVQASHVIESVLRVFFCSLYLLSTNLEVFGYLFIAMIQWAVHNLTKAKIRLSFPLVPSVYVELNSNSQP